MQSTCSLKMKFSKKIYWNIFYSIHKYKPCKNGWINFALTFISIIIKIPGKLYKAIGGVFLYMCIIFLRGNIYIIIYIFIVKFITFQRNREQKIALDLRVCHDSDSRSFFQDEGKIAHTALTQKTCLCSKEQQRNLMQLNKLNEIKQKVNKNCYQHSLHFN